MGNSTGIAKLMSPELKIPNVFFNCNTFQSFFMFCKDLSICVCWARPNLLFQYQKGSVGGLI